MKSAALALALIPAARTPVVLPASPLAAPGLAAPAPLAPALIPALPAPVAAAAPSVAAPSALASLNSAASLAAPAKPARPDAPGRDAFWEQAAERALSGGAPIPLHGAKLKSDHGHYDYVRREIVIARSTLADPRALAITLAHELRHVAQHAEGVIAEALEMELEAHLDSLDMARELGLPLDGFQAGFARHAARGRDALYRWMSGQMPGKTVLRGADYEELADELETELETVSARRRPAVERDLALLSTLAGRAANRALAARVARRLNARAP